MTKNNAVFLGACSLLAPSVYLQPSQIHANAKHALEWSNLIYEEQHNGIAAPEKKEVYYVIERRFMNSSNMNSSKWLLSFIFSNSFTSEEAADLAIDQYLQKNPTTERRYRVVRKELE